MPKIGIIYGMENTFPPALVDRINSKKAPGVRAEHIKIGAIRAGQPSEYDVIIDRISHHVDFFRVYLKQAVLHGAYVINNPFWWSADDKFFNYALAGKLGVAVPKTVVLPHKMHPPGTTTQSMRNLTFPLNWEEIFDYVGFPAFLKPLNGGGWKNVYKVHSPEEFFRAYDQTDTLCMTLQTAVNYTRYFRCYVIGQEKVRVMRYDPHQPLHMRYLRDDAENSHDLHDRIVSDCLKVCRALGYDFNTVEFAVEEGVPYAIDFLNPAPDADIHSVGQANFDWVVENVAQLAIEKALAGRAAHTDLRWTSFLNGPAELKEFAGVRAATSK